MKSIEELIFSTLPSIEGPQQKVIDAMHYSVKAGGKRLRPMMMQESFFLFGGTGREIEPFMAALEYIHTYSLIHDDLPAMDNDEYRRGQKTTHIVYGEDLAILAGDALLNYAFEVASRSDSPNAMKALRVLGKKAGIFGMVGGQCADVISENEDKNLKLDDILFIHENKTAALIEAALMIGAIMAGATDEQVALMEKVGSNIGLAFQVQDDILDATGTFEKLGKPIGSDEKNQKATYLSLKGLEASKQCVEQLSNEAVAILKSQANRNEFLEELILSLINRDK